MRALLLACLLAAPAHADDDDKTAQARELFAAGLALFNSGSFEAATQAFEAGYRLAPLPLFLFNAGQAARKGGKKAEAVAFYQRFLSEDQTSPQRAEAAEHLRQLQDELKSSPPAVVAAPPPPPAPAPPPPRWYRDPAGGALLGAGAAVAVVGVGLLANGGAIIAGAGDTYQTFDQAHSSAPPFTIAGGVILAGGLVLAAAAAVRYAVVARRRK
jgi:tetratricopeptide (TPR) repeat protein